MPQRRRPLGPPPGYRVFRGLGGNVHRVGENYQVRGDGTPGNLIDTYDERSAWGQTGPYGTITPPPPVGGGPAPGLPYGLTTVPFGTILGPDGLPLKWLNPTSVANFPIQATTAVNPPPIAPTPVLSLNPLRNLLVIQNNSVAPTAGDIAPTLFVAFNAQPQIGFALGLTPGVGVTFDIICPRDSVYIAWGTFSNAGASVVIQGVVVQGTYTPYTP